MERLSRRDFIKGLGGLGLWALGSGALPSCVGREQAPPVTERVVIELAEGEDYLKLERGGVRCLGCLNRCVIEEGGRGICEARQNRRGRLYDLDPPEELSLKEAMWYRRLRDKKVWCQLCFRECIIPERGKGFCRVRENRGGKLYSLVYGKTASWQIMPVEKDTMYHLLPNADVFALATASCNFRCKQCQNWQITQRGPEELTSLDWPPEEVVLRAISDRCTFISCTVNEPTVFYEYMYDIARLAKEKGLMTLFRSNGAMRPEPLRELLKYMDGVSLDLKGFSDDFYREVLSAELEPVLETLKILKEEGVWFEITNLVIPTLNDDLGDIRRMCIWIKENLGEETLLHFNRFFPAYKLTHLPPTPIETLEMAREIAVDVGLRYVYIGNVPGHNYNSTFCPSCGKKVIQRIHFMVLEINLAEGKCKFCGHQIPGIWWD